ncbi:hypothetical protein ACFRFH_11910 [Leifsonia sp. NPDC056824]|uniref:hypothetical protein n=1 Tax=Leifsonia sp. NPDC056824 TaxID=3345953 RepID=UPI00367E9423
MERIIFDTDGIEPVAVIEVGDVVEAAKNTETITAPLVAYNGLLYIGQSGRSLDYYQRNGFRLRLVARS